MKNIVLTGFMGTGKSSVGKVLAERLGYKFCDLDTVIMGETGLSINDIFAEHGEARFRALESRAVQRVASKQGMVIATGGGAVIDPENRRLLRASGVVVNLCAPPELILERLRSESDRPLLKDDRSLEKIEAMLHEREPFYADADIRIDTAGKKVEDVAQEILAYLHGKL